MPELPEVEVVRAGLEPHIVGRTVADVTIHDDRVLKKHLTGPPGFVTELKNQVVRAACRRGKFLWFPIHDGHRALTMHLGMSGQALVQPAGTAPVRHERVTITLHDGSQISYVDQRMFGGLAVVDMVPDVDGEILPETMTHIARDALDDQLDIAGLAVRIKKSSSQIKRVLLNQRIVSGVGNIYADEALWRNRTHYAQIPGRMSVSNIQSLLGHVQDVMTEALEQGGTSFDALYVNVNGMSGYFSRSLNVYGQEGEPCGNCGTEIKREAFMNRSSHFCPKCQRKR